VKLTDEAVGRAALPEIRKRELFNAGKILGISNHFFLDEKDVRNTQDVDEVLTQHWKADIVLQEVKRRMEVGKYDFVFTLFPTAETHGGHKAATLTAIAAAKEQQDKKPVVLGCRGSSAKDQKPLDWTGFKSELHPFVVMPDRYSVDRNVKFGFNDVLSYQIIVNWVVTEHKSQGAYQLAIGRGDKEEYAILDTGTPAASEKASKLFGWLSETAPHPVEFESQAAH